jgi:hypothetical protein
MSMIRLIWPDIEAAYTMGHTLKVIHERIVQIGIPISYRVFTVYVSRLRRQVSAAKAEKRQTASLKPGAQVQFANQSTAVPNALANFQDRCIENPPPRFNPEGDRPDENKLI